jgi:hypothetical protein
VAEKEVGLKIVANAEEATKAFKDVKEQFEKVSEGAEILSKLIEGDFSGALEKATTATKLFGAASEAAFAPLAIISFAKTIVDAGNSLSEFISKMYIFTDADKKADEQLKENNKTLLEYANKTKQAGRELELAKATSEDAKDKLRLKFQIEDGGTADQLKQKLKDMVAEMAKLRVAAQETESISTGNDLGESYQALTANAVAAEKKLKELGDAATLVHSQIGLQEKEEAITATEISKRKTAEAEQAEAASEREAAQVAAAFQRAQQQQMQAFQQGLQKQKDAADAYHAVSKADEAAYWADILKQSNVVGANRQQIEHNFTVADKAAKLQSLHDEVEGVRAKVAAEKAGSQDRVKLLDDELAKLKAEGKEETADYKKLAEERKKADADVIKAKDEAIKKAAKLQDDIGKIELVEAQEHSKVVHDMAQTDADFELKAGKITAEQHQQMVRNALAQEYQDQSQAIKDKMMLLIQEGKTETTEYANLHKQLIKIDDDYHKNSTKLTQQWILQQRQQYQQYFNQFNQQFNTALNGMINGTETASQAFTKMFQDMLQQLVQFVEAWIEKKVEMWIMDKRVDDGGSQDQVDNAAQANSAMALSDASLAAANAYAAFAWDPIEASLAAADAYMTVSAMSVAAGVSGAAKFEKGGIIPQTGLILAHAGETILPASMSGTGAGLPSMAGGGAGANLHVHFNMSAVDGESAARFIKGQSRNIATVVYKEMRKKGLSG